jgi:sugar phosphate isomerase/epimerase
MIGPKLACPNLYQDVNKLKSLAFDCGFQGIDWTLRTEDLPKNRLEEARFVNSMARLAPLEVRFHLFFPDNELGDSDPCGAESARRNFSATLDLISKVGGRFATVHVGLCRDSMNGMSWDNTIVGLRDIASKGRELGIQVCLENLIRGWTGRPDLYEKLIRAANCRGTLDIGHARVCESVAGKTYGVEDFALWRPERILNAHIYHEETQDGHVPPEHSSDLDDRLRLLQALPFCDWWVLELREEKALMQTLGFVKEFLQANEARAAV